METTKLSSEGREITVLLEQVWHRIQLLDESIVRYIDGRGDEALSYRGYFDKRFPALAEKMRGIDEGVSQLLELEAE